MTKKHVYVSKEPDADGLIHYGEVDDATWARLFERQRKHVADKACDEFLDGLDHISFTHDKIPQHPHVSKQLDAHHGWGVQQVPALITASEFSTLLSK